MGNRDFDLYSKLAHLLQTEEDQALDAEISLRHLKECEGLPILNLEQLDQLNDTPGLLLFTKTVYDRFSAQPRSGYKTGPSA